MVAGLFGRFVGKIKSYDMYGRSIVFTFKGEE